MAARRTVDLGTVGFGLTADTKGLEASLRTLRAFGRQVDQTANSVGWADQLYKKFASIERILATLHTRVAATTQRMREAGVAAAEIDKVEQAYRRLSNTLTQKGAALGPHEIARGVVGMRAILSEGGRLAGASEVNKFALAFRDLERAAILAVGPLSGIGARLAVMAALFESVTAKTALLIAGITGVTVGFGLMAASSVKAVMEQERFDAQLTAATGAASLVADEYVYISGVANKLGQNIRALQEPYSKFATAARLSNIPLAEQRRIFEAAITAGTALRLNNERMGLVFLALEQMMSKGTVTMEELRRQLGDLLPGAFELAAGAMGMTVAQFAKAVANGEVLAKDLLPKLADALNETFGPSAEQAAKSLQAAINRLSTSAFELQKRFDEATGFSKLFRNALELTRQALDFFARNMEDVIATMGALAGAGAGMLLYSLLVRIPVAVRAVITSFAALKAAIIALDIATMATGLGAILSILAKIGLVVTGAAVGFALLRKEIDPLASKTAQWVDKTKEWLDVQEQIGKSHQQTTEEIRKGTAARLTAALGELAAVDLQIQAYQQAEQQVARSAARMTMSRGGQMQIVPSQQLPEGDISALEARRDKLGQLRTELEGILDRLGKLKVQVPGVTTTTSTAWDNWVEKIEKDFRKLQTLDAQIAAADFGKEAMQSAEGLGEAIQHMTEQPEKGRGSIEGLAKTLREAGFEGKNFTEQLAAMYATIERRKDTLREIEQFPKKFAAAADAVVKMFEELENRRKAATAADPDRLASQERLATSITNLTDKLRDMKLTQEQVNEQVELFRRKWQEVEEAEVTSRQIKKLREEIERLNDAIGSRSERAIEQYNDRLELLDKALRNSVISAQEYARMLDLVQADVNRQIVDRTTIMGRQLRDLFTDIERNASKMFVDILRTGKTSWKDLFDSMAQYMMEFLAKMMVIAPIMRGLFGGLYSGNAADVGTGMLENWLRGFSSGAPANPATMDLSALEGSVGPFEGFAQGGSFTVPGGGGTDSQLVAFRATPGERVDVVPAGGRSEGSMAVKVVINNQTGVQVAATASPVRNDVDGMVVELFLHRLSRDAGARNQLRGLLTAPSA